MLILRGATALSDFRIQKLLTQCRDAGLPVTRINTEYVHFADLTETLSEQEKVKLESLLEYGPTSSVEAPTGQLKLVVPRPGTISPWSSKAT